MMRRLCLGFDLRVREETRPELSSQHFDERYDPCHRATVSGDPNVWRRRKDIEALLNDNVGSLSNPLTLARSLDDLLSACKDRDIAPEDMVSIALTCGESNLIALEQRFGNGWFEQSQDELLLISAGWKFGGFDILDLNGLVSGLNGTGYKPDMARAFFACFSNFLSDRGK